MTIVLVIEYDGTGFHGYAQQSHGRTVAGTLWETISLIEGPNLEIFGAGRTDAGVHARGQCVHFVSHLPIAARKWKRILNRSLPDDIRVLSARAEPEGFHARFSALSRTYRYTFLNRPSPSVFLERYAFHEPRALDVGLMNEAGQAFVGEHDFRAFAKEPDPARSTVRNVMSTSVVVARPYVRFNVEANAFVRGMVRMMGGALWEIGLGKRNPGDLPRMLAEPAWGRRPQTLPAQGLCLMRVRYGAQPRCEGQDEELE